jgi:predicted aspartyl protease
MGFVHVEVGVSNPSTPDVEERVEVLVDTGATRSVIPRVTLEKLGAKPIASSNFRGFGGAVQRETGALLMRYDGAVASITVVFGEGDDPPIMGVTALESLGYEVDSVKGELRRTEMLLLPVASVA